MQTIPQNLNIRVAEWPRPDVRAAYQRVDLGTAMIAAAVHDLQQNDPEEFRSAVEFLYPPANDDLPLRWAADVAGLSYGWLTNYLHQNRQEWIAARRHAARREWQREHKRAGKMRRAQ